ncbi:MAG TPA: hypothetical protein H9841_04420 [Candidatus Flavonifractor merdigallinarum]|uniref:SGNH hydrolase-type esterase domain-containing protein n=1 Tax=Candidatus Flavonifractor merdigallinarum TaxID=2838589 RepID=A0A9D1Y8C1_9FIRM|nr:hypothetical protein [Candidatus Flavonifractor merdigallinarum]
MSHRRRRGPSIPLLLAGLVVCAGLLIAPTLTRALRSPEGTAASPAPTAAPTPAITPTMPIQSTATPTLAPTATPKLAPTPTPAAQFDYTQPAPQTPVVDMSYFSDALFIGDSRTEGLQLYSGIEGATFFCYKGITIFDVMQNNPKKLIKLNGTSYSIVDALTQKSGKFSKVYISLGINELGYYDNQGFHDKFAALIDHIRATQPNAIIYLQNQVPVNPTLCAKNWPSYVNNDKVAVYNEIFTQLAVEKKVVLLDVATALSTPEGILAQENTVDGVHFTKGWYKEWLSYLMCHTVDPNTLG